MRVKPIKQRPWFIPFISSFVVDKTLGPCGLTPENPLLNRTAYEASVPLIPPGRGRSVESVDVKVPCADGSSFNDARLWTQINSERAAEDTKPIVVYIHGGGWMLGNCAAQPYTALGRQICSEYECSVLSINYRLAPENPWPAAVDDVYQCLLWLGSEESRTVVNGDRQKLILMGESAGGNLAACASLMWRDRQPKGVTIAHQVLFSPCIPTRPLRPTRLDPSRANGALLPEWLMEYFEEQYAGDGVDISNEQYANPLSAKSLSGLPPLTGIVGGAEVLRDEGIEYFEAVKAAGNEASWKEFEDGYHGFVVFPFGQSREAWAYVRERLGKAL